MVDAAFFVVALFASFLYGIGADENPLGNVAFNNGLHRAKVMATAPTVAGQRMDTSFSRAAFSPLSSEQIIPGDKLSPPVGTQMAEDQIKTINTALKRQGVVKGSPGAANLLVWGLGNDSPFWTTLTSGRVVFLEDSLQWIAKITAKYPMLEVYPMNYTTQIAIDFERYTNSSEHWNDLDLRWSLPQDVVDEDWDVIIVDAPRGDQPYTVGRFGSIYTSKLLLKKPGDVFVDDCERNVEATMSRLVYNEQHLLATVGRTLTSWRNPNEQCHFLVMPEEDIQQNKS